MVGRLGTSLLSSSFLDVAGWTGCGDEAVVGRAFVRTIVSSRTSDEKKDGSVSISIARVAGDSGVEQRLEFDESGERGRG
jgi:hypothetical protein